MCNGIFDSHKLDPFTTNCIPRTDGMSNVCKSTYGNEWFPWPQKNSSWEQGCESPPTGTRATCRKDDMVPIGTVFTNMSPLYAGDKCTTVGAVGLYNPDFGCITAYGPNYKPVGTTQTVDVAYGTPTDSNDPNADYTDFSAAEDSCTLSNKTAKCEKTRDIGDFKNSICLWTNRSCGGYTLKNVAKVLVLVGWL